MARPRFRAKHLGVAASQLSGKPKTGLNGNELARGWPGRTTEPCRVTRTVSASCWAFPDSLSDTGQPNSLVLRYFT